MGISVLTTAPPAVALSSGAPPDVVTTNGAAGASNQAARADHTHKLIDTGWIAPTLLNGWVLYDVAWGPIGYRKIGNIVIMRGLLKGGTLGAAMFNVPSGFRPALRQLFVVYRDANVDGRIDVTAAGDVLAQVAATGWTSINEVTYVADA